MKVLSRLTARIPLRLGMVANPQYPAGRRALFYRDKNGQHHPILNSNEPTIAFLASPRYYRNLIDTHRAIDGRANLKVNSLPASIKKELFPEFKQAFIELVALGVREVVWDETGLYSKKVVREFNTGTFFMSKTGDQFIEQLVTDSQLEQSEAG